MTSYIIVTAILIVLALLYIKLAEKFNIVDRPNHRSSHTKNTIRGGGILFYLALLIFFVSSNFQYPYLIAGVSLIAIVSFADDIITLSYKIRLPFQFLSLALMLVQLFLPIEEWWLILLFVIVGIGFINIYNFMDGINGVTFLYSFSVLLLYYFINQEEQIINQDLIIYLGISLLIFGFYNARKKARFFAGDIGSISMAMVLFFIGLMMAFKLKAPIILLAFMLYGADTLTTMVYRKYIGEKITEAHRHHIYQKLVDILKWSHLKTSGVYAVIQLLLNILVFYLYNDSLFTQWLIYFGLIVLFIGFYIFIFIRVKKIKAKQEVSAS